YPVPFEAKQLARGLVGWLTLDAGEYLRVAEALAAWGPVPRLRLTGVTPQARALAGCAGMAAVTELDLGSGGVTDLDLLALLQSPHLARLTWLNLGSSHGSSSHNTLTAEAARLLAVTTALPGLKHLRLDANRIGDEGMAALTRGSALRDLATLSV